MIRNAIFLLPVAVPQDFVRGRFTRNGSCGRTLVTASVKNSASATTPAPLSIREPPVVPLAGASSRFLVSDKADRSSPTVKLPAVKSPHFIYVLKAIKQVMMNVNFASATCPSDRCWNMQGSKLPQIWGSADGIAFFAVSILGTAGNDLANNMVFMSAFLSWLAAQIMKYFTAFYRSGKWDYKVMFDSGGMPSSHTSLVVGLTTAIGYHYGLGSTLFPLSLAFSLIVMYDAAGVRRHAGKQAEVLNKILEDMFHGSPISETKLKEVLGHSPLQVAAGAFLGIIVGVLYMYRCGIGYAAGTLY